MSETLFYPLEADIAARRDLPASAKILRAIIRFRIGENGFAWSGTRRLAKESSLDRSTVMDATSRLEAAGLLRVDRRGNGLVNHYHLPPKCGGEISPVEKLDRSEKSTISGGQVPPEAVENCHPKRTQKNIEKNKKAAAPPDPRIRSFIDWFSQQYETAHGRPYIVAGGKDGMTIKRLLQSLPLDELHKSAMNMLADQWGKDHASIGLLSTQINTWRGGKPIPTGKASTFTPATTDGTDYGSLAQRF